MEANIQAALYIDTHTYTQLTHINIPSKIIKGTNNKPIKTNAAATNETLNVRGSSDENWGLSTLPPLSTTLHLCRFARSQLCCTLLCLLLLLLLRQHMRNLQQIAQTAATAKRRTRLRGMIVWRGVDFSTSLLLLLLLPHKKLCTSRNKCCSAGGCKQKENHHHQQSASQPAIQHNHERSKSLA